MSKPFKIKVHNRRHKILLKRILLLNIAMVVLIGTLENIKSTSKLGKILLLIFTLLRFPCSLQSWLNETHILEDTGAKRVAWHLNHWRPYTYNSDDKYAVNLQHMSENLDNISLRFYCIVFALILINFLHLCNKCCCRDNASFNFVTYSVWSI